MFFAAGLDGNPQMRFLINMPRFCGALNQTGSPHHWFDRYASSTAFASSFATASYLAGRPYDL